MSQAEIENINCWPQIKSLCATFQKRVQETKLSFNEVYVINLNCKLIGRTG